MSTTIKLRRGNALKAASDNVALAAGEIGVESDTGKFKIGDGSSPWNSLPYATDLSRLPSSVVSVDDPHTGDVAQWNGTEWVPANAGVDNDGLVGTTIADLTSVTGANTTFYQSGGVPIANACRVNAAATRLAFEVDSPGSSLTSGQNLIGIYDTAGNLVMETGDLSAAWSGGGDYDIVVVDLPETLQPSFYYAVVLMNYAGTPPYLTGAYCPMIPEIGTRFSAVPRVSYSSGTYTTLPSSIDWSTDGFQSNPWNFVTFIGLLP
jgi:major tropism determinant Mtd-like protein